MKNKCKAFGLAIVVMAITLSFTACGDGGGGDNGKETGAPVSTPTVDTITQDSITINAASFTAGNPGSQTIEYAINGTNAAPSTGWQDGLTFSGLSPETTYYIFARSKANETHNAGTASAGLSVITAPEWTWVVTNASTYPATSTKTHAISGETDGTRNTEIGDTGPGGGIIFYISDTDFTVEGYTGATGSFDSYTAHYLEAAPADMPTGLAWLLKSFGPTGTGTAIGTGRENTALILATDALAPAAKACAEYANSSGKTDWFLPSKAELNELYKNRSSVGMTAELYWSSSAGNSSNPWDQSFSSGAQLYGNMSSRYSVRAVRAF
jgi:hypothetical protein